jgi:hypothetical protein
MGKEFHPNEAITMKGVSFVTDDTNRKVAVQIDLETLKQYGEDVEDLLDGIIATMRSEEETVPLDEVVENLRKQGKIS